MAAVARWQHRHEGSSGTRAAVARWQQRHDGSSLARWQFIGTKAAVAIDGGQTDIAPLSRKKTFK
jgi:hypothetical protein